MTSNITLRTKRPEGRHEPQNPKLATRTSHPPQQASKGPENRPDGTIDGERVVAVLSERFRIIAEDGSDPRQWFLQRRSGQSWAAISYCTSRDGLLLSVREKCIPMKLFQHRHSYPGLDAKAVAAIKALPDRFPRKACRA